MNTFPIIYKDSNQIDSYKENFEKKIDEIERFISEKKNFLKKDILNALSSSTNFYLHYNGKDITNLQKKYSSLVSKLTEKIYPNLKKKNRIKQKT